MIEPRGAGAVPADHGPGDTAEHEMNDAKARPAPRPEDEPSMAQLLDPMAWERRLQEARARRAEALASREGKGGRPAARDGSPDPTVSGPSTNAAITPAARPALADDTRPQPATGPAIAETGGGPSIRELAARDEASATPAAATPESARFQLHSLPPRPPVRDRIAELPPVLRRGQPLAEPHAPETPPEPEAGIIEARRPAPKHFPVPALEAEPAEAEAHDTTAEEPALGAAPFLTVPPRPAQRRGHRRSGARVAIVFVAGLGLGLAGALTLSGPMIERMGAFLSASDTTASRPAPETAMSGGIAGTDTADASAGDGAPAADNSPDLPEGNAAAPAEVAALTLPAVEPAGSAPPLVVPEGKGPAFLPLPTAIPQPAAPGPASVASVPDWPEALASPPLPTPPNPETVAGTAPPGSLGLARPLARPTDLPKVTPEAEAAVDLAALTPDVTDMEADTATAGAINASQADAPQVEGRPAEAGESSGVEEITPAASTGVPERVLVHVPSALSGPAAEAAIGALRGAGFDLAQRIDIAFPIGSTNIRYYFPKDRAAAEAMAAAIRAETGQEAVARDFTSFRPQPSEGTVEIFLAGQPRQVPQSQQAASPPRANMPPGPPVSSSVEVRRLSTPPAQARSSQEAMHDLERLADEIARAIAGSLRD